MKNIISYIPHRPPVLLIDKVSSRTENSIICICDWQQKTFFHDDNGVLIPCAMVEMIAQSAAIMNAKDKVGNDKPKIGMLTAVKKFEFHRLPQNQSPLEIIVTTEGQLGNHKIVEGKVLQQDNILAKGLVFLYLNENN